MGGFFLNRLTICGFKVRTAQKYKVLYRYAYEDDAELSPAFLVSAIPNLFAVFAY